MTELSSFNRTIQKTNVWLKSLGESLGVLDEQKAYRALKAVLQTLRDRLIVEEAFHLGEQLPMLVRGFYYEGYRPTDKPLKLNRQEFLVLVEKRLQDPEIDPELAVRAVLKLLEEKISPGEVEDIMSEMPKDIKELF